ncbi:MAG: choice-of-anchor Q domain-containing protein [Candidatus Marinimicrobia bacterium]|nr:choice-of-anchor Q domain-containing protein [Candidatus Neomarinimicrobiota bacterium]
MKKQIFYILITIILFTGSNFASIIYVPDSISTIQHAIDSVNVNDTIIVKDGTYNENINFSGKNLTIASQFFINQKATHIDNTIISASDSGSIVIFANNEDSTSVLMGFTLKNGKALSNTNKNGGGIYCRNSSPQLLNLNINKSYADSCGGGIYFYNSNAICKYISLTNDSAKIFGGGIYLKNSTQLDTQITITKSGSENNGAGFYIDNSNLVLSQSKITENSSTNSGAGIFIKNSILKTDNSLIADNKISSGNGSAIYSEKSQIELVNNTIANNNNSDELVLNTTNFTSKNSIIWETINVNSDSATIIYSDIFGGWTGTGNLDKDPIFVSDTLDYKLSDSSYCIGMGTNDINFSTDIDGNERPNPADSYCDIGAYENSRRAPINIENIYYITLLGNEINGNGSQERPFSKIQSGINNASIGDTILIAPGTYHEAIEVDKSLFIGSHILTTNDTSYMDSTGIVVDSAITKSAIYIHDTGSENVIVNGLTLENGKGIYQHPSHRGGGIFCNSTKAHLYNLKIKNSTAEYGAGIDISNSEIVLSDVLIDSNFTAGWGGGISIVASEVDMFDVDILNNEASMGGGIYTIDNSNINLQNVNILNNSATENATLSPLQNSLFKTGEIQSILYYGGGIDCENSEIFLQNTIVAKNNSDGNGAGISVISGSKITSINSTITENISQTNGGAIFFDWNSKGVIANSILWNNSPQEIYLNDDSLWISYSDVDGGINDINDSGFVNYTAENKNVNPQFINVSADDFHLNSTSNCKNVGTNFFVFQGDTLIDLSNSEYDGSAPDFGAYGSNPNIEKPNDNPNAIEVDVIPNEFVISNPYPNPFNPSIHFVFQLPQPGLVKINIYNILGQKVVTLVNKIMPEGRHYITWFGINANGVSVSSGVYFVNYFIDCGSAGSIYKTQKILFLK